VQFVAFPIAPPIGLPLNDRRYKIDCMNTTTPDQEKPGTRFSHIVIFWVDPANPKAADELIEGAERYLRPIPHIGSFHVGKMVPSNRPVVDQSYQVGLNVTFPSKQAQDDYQVHPLHVEFVEKVFKRVCQKVVVYDFQ
jgi:hypothetical protein